MTSFSAFDHKRWAEYGLADFGDYAECVEYVNQSEYGDGTLEGEWYYIPDEPLSGGARVIYCGTFGNYNSPGASSYTYAEIFDVSNPGEAAEFDQRKAEWESFDEYEDGEQEDEQDIPF